MSELPISSPYRSTPDAPVTEFERNTLNARLNAAFEAGSLDSDDFAARLDRLFAAQRMGELVPVVQGLPPLPTYEGPTFGDASGTGVPGQLSDSRSATRMTLAIIAVLVAVVLLIAILLIVLL